MGAKEEAGRLSRVQREVLVAHVREKQPIDNTIGATEGWFRKTCQSLLHRELIRLDQTGSPARARFTVLTDLGRETVCHVLGEYADGLVTAGILERLPIITVRQRVAYSIVPDGGVEVISPADIKSSSAPVS